MPTLALSAAKHSTFVTGAVVTVVVAIAVEVVVAVAGQWSDVVEGATTVLSIVFVFVFFFFFVLREPYPILALLINLSEFCV